MNRSFTDQFGEDTFSGHSKTENSLSSILWKYIFPGPAFDERALTKELLGKYCENFAE